MGMFGEINASENAKFLDKVLLEAIKTKDENIIQFAKKHLYQRYLHECGEAWQKSNPEILSAYNNPSDAKPE